MRNRHRSHRQIRENGAARVRTVPQQRSGKTLRDAAGDRLREAEAILKSDALSALTLRAVARRAGVSHMAPTPHFGDLTGLLSELAALGYQRFNRMLSKANADPGDRSLAAATAHAYVRFAQTEPAMFLLMFRSERLDFTRPALADAAREASRLLTRSADADGQAGSGLAGIGRAIGNWSVVHGFAMLLIDGRLTAPLCLPGVDGRVDILLDEALKA